MLNSYNSKIQIQNNVINFSCTSEPILYGYFSNNAKSFNAGKIEILEKLYNHNCKILRENNSNIDKVNAKKSNEKIVKQLIKAIEPKGIIEKSIQEKRENAEQTVKRTRAKVFDYAICNSWKYYNEKNEKIIPKFMTLTFADDCTNIEIANREFTKFIQRLNYYLYNNKKAMLKYIAVPEIQHNREKKYNKAVWHFHVLFFNLDRLSRKQMKDITKIWGKGVINIKALKKNKKDSKNYKNFGQISEEEFVARYVSKYITKEIGKGKEKIHIFDYYKKYGLEGKRKVFPSRGLKTSKIKIYLMENEQQKVVIDILRKKCFNFYETKNEYRGNYTRLQTRLSTNELNQLNCP